MRVITVANQKGGCAKTTTVVNLAASLVSLGHRVLVIDLDAQANSSAWLGVEQPTPGAFGLLAGKQEIVELIAPSRCSGVDIIPASRELASVDKLLVGELASEGILMRRLKALPQGRWDYVLIDTPPTIGLVTINAMVAATDLLIPVTTHVMTLSGVAQLVRAYEDVKALLNPVLNILGFLPSRVDLRTRHSQEILDAMTERFGSKVLTTRIHENIRLAEAPSFGQSILGYKPKSSAAADYMSLAREVVQLTRS